MKGKISFVFISFLFSTVLFSQKKHQQIEALLDSAYQNAIEVKYTKSIAFAKEALDKSRESKYEYGIAYSCFYIAQAIYELGRYKSSLKYLELVEKSLYYDSDPFLKYEVHRVRSRVYGATLLFEKSVKEQKKGLLYVELTRRSESEKKILTSLAYDNILNTFLIEKKLDSAFVYVEKNRKLLLTLDESMIYPYLINLYTTMGDLYAERSDYNKAIVFFEKTESIINKYQYNYRSSLYIKWGDMEFMRNNVDASLGYYQRALKSLEEYRFEHDLAIVYEKLAAVYELKGKNLEAKENRLKFLELDNKIKREQFESSQYVLNSILKDTQKKHKNSRKQLIVVLVFIIAVTLFFLVLYLKVKRKNKKVVYQSKQKEVTIEQLQHKVSEVSDELIRLAINNSPEFWNRFQEVYPDYLKKMILLNSDLTVQELIITAYHYLGFSTKDIAKNTFKTKRTIEGIRYRLRKKLDLPHDENFILWIRKYIDGI